ncbi:MAG: hypothetical protein ACE5JP_17010 [Candidatus Bipolaricaulia bacterium]
MEREPTSLTEKLTTAVAIDYPEASEILVSFTDKWELVHQMGRGDTPLYIAAMPPSKEEPRRDHFYGLAPEINLELTTYRHYKFFEPWPLPSIHVSWDETTGTGRVEGMGDLKIQLNSLGQAQAYYGKEVGLIWEAYFHRGTEIAEVTWVAFWEAVERDLGVGKIYTEPHEPTLDQEDYTDFLSRLGYAPDPDNPRWWSKTIE